MIPLRNFLLLSFLYAQKINKKIVLFSAAVEHLLSRKSINFKAVAAALVVAVVVGTSIELRGERTVKLFSL